MEAITIRVTPELKQELERRAALGRRSLTATLALILERSLDLDPLWEPTYASE